MSLTIEQGRASGEAIAKRNLTKFGEAEAKYRTLIVQYRGDIPYALVLAHLITVNPKIDSNPAIWRSRKGFLYAGLETARYAALDFERCSIPEVCAYVWSLELNRAARLLCTNNASLFRAPSLDFWKCIYLQYRIGPHIWKILWQATAPKVSEGDVYPQLVYVVNNMTQRISGWPVEKLRQEVLVTLEQVFYTWRIKGTGVVDGFGRVPVAGNTENFNKLFFGN
jgi:hypothetical protein